MAAVRSLLKQYFFTPVLQGLQPYLFQFPVRQVLRVGRGASWGAANPMFMGKSSVAIAGFFADRTG
jgi:hypothetical protein